MGYEGIEIWAGRPHMYRNDLDDQLEEIASLLAACKIEVCNLIPAQFRYPSILCSENEEVRKSSVEYIKSALDNAAKIGSPSISLCPGMVLFDQDKKRGWRQLVKSFKEIEEYNSGKKRNLLIEPAHMYETNLIRTVEDGLRMLDELKSDSFGLLLDTGHCFINGEDFTKILPSCSGIPLHIHIDDNDGDRDAHLIPGKGSIDFKSLASALRDFGYEGYLSAELGQSYIMDPSEACRETLAKLTSMFQR